jgi:hypothetical protein
VRYESCFGRGTGADLAAGVTRAQGCLGNFSARGKAFEFMRLHQTGDRHQIGNVLPLVDQLGEVGKLLICLVNGDWCSNSPRKEKRRGVAAAFNSNNDCLITWRQTS